MSVLTDKILESKRLARIEHASKSFSEKIAILEKLRERNRLVASTPLRRTQARVSPQPLRVA